MVGTNEGKPMDTLAPVMEDLSKDPQRRFISAALVTFLCSPIGKEMIRKQVPLDVEAPAMKVGEWVGRLEKPDAPLSTSLSELSDHLGEQLRPFLQAARISASSVDGA